MNHMMYPSTMKSMTWSAGDDNAPRNPEESYNQMGPSNGIDVRWYVDNGKAERNWICDDPNE